MMATVLAWGTNFVAVKVIYTQIAPSTLALTRAIPMFFALLALCKCQGLELRYRGFRDATLLMGLGALSMGVYMVFFLEALKYVTAADGAILMASSPIWVTLLACLFKQESFRPTVLLGAVVALVGVGLVTARTGPLAIDPKGVGLMLTAALCWAFSVVLSKWLMADRTPLQVLMLSMPGCFLVLLPYGFQSTVQTPWSEVHLTTWLALGHISLLAGAVGFFGFYRAVRDIGPVGAMLHQFFVPPTAMITGVLLLGDRVIAIQIAGMCLVFAGVYLAQQARKGDLPEPLTARGEAR